MGSIGQVVVTSIATQMRKLIKVSLKIAIVIIALNSTIECARSATLLLNSDPRFSFPYERILSKNYNLDFIDNLSRSQQNLTKINIQKIDKKTDDRGRQDIQKDLLIYNEDPEKIAKSQKIIDRSLSQKIDDRKTLIDSTSETANLESTNYHISGTKDIQSGNTSEQPISSVLEDRSNYVVREGKALDTLLDSKVERNIIETNNVPVVTNSPANNEQVIIANNLIVSESKENFDRLPTPVIFLFSILIYGGIIAAVSMQIAIRFGIDLSTIIYWIRTIANSQNKYKKPKIKAVATKNKILDRHTQDRILEKKILNKELEEFKKIEKNIATRSIGDRYLTDAIEIIKIAVDNKQSFANLDRYETTYRGSKQQQFYSYTMEIICSCIESGEFSFQKFKLSIEHKLQEILEQIKTDIGKQALQEYTKELLQITSTQLGLKLIYLLRQSQASNNSTIDSIFDIVNEASKVNLLDTELLNKLTIANWESLEKFGKVINLSERQNSPNTYVKILQYVGLYYKYQNYE
jgi:hypothetical protein